jgi:hypothetical protein
LLTCTNTHANHTKFSTTLLIKEASKNDTAMVVMEGILN